MERVYRIKSGDLIHIGKKFAEFKEHLRPSSIDQFPQTYDDVKNLLGIQSNVEEDLLENSISLNNLAQPDDIPICDVDLHKLHTKQGQNTVEIPNKAMRLKCIQHRIENDGVKSGPSVYEPFTYKRGEGTKRKPRLSHEFFVLGRQKLTELCDKIYCYSKFGPFTDISDDFESIQKTNFDEPPENRTTNQSDPGYFFITDTFYNDYRVSGTDYSTEIREWVSRHTDFGPVQVKSMGDTKFQDLNVRVGFPQLYRHSVNCEHIISITDIRLLALDDILQSSAYPILRCVSSSRMILCAVCGIIEASFVVRNGGNHIQDP